jgi:hypothetical protein
VKTDIEERETEGTEKQESKNLFRRSSGAKWYKTLRLGFDGEPGRAAKIKSVATRGKESAMKRFFVVSTAAILMFTAAAAARQASSSGPYKILKTVKAGGNGGFDYLSADSEGRHLYTPRGGANSAGLMVFNLDTLDPVGTITGISSGAAVVDPKSHHGFSNTNPITMWDSEKLQTIKTIDVNGRPDGMLYDPFNARVWVLSHQPPYATVIDAASGTVVDTVDLGGAPEQAATDGKGKVYINISDKANVAVVDAKTLMVTAHYDCSSKGMGGSGLSLDAKNHVLFAYYRQPSPVVVILNADNGSIITTLPTGTGVDTVAFNPDTMEAISAEGGGTMTFIKESSPTSFAVEQTLTTMVGAKTMTLDTKTGHIFTMTAEYGPPPTPAAAPAAPPAGAQAGAPGGPAGPGGQGDGRGAGGGQGGFGGPGRGFGRGRGPMIPDSFTVLMIGK